MKRAGKTYNAAQVKEGRRLAAWAADGMNWADGPFKNALMGQGAAIRASRALGQAIACHGGRFKTQSGVTALIQAMGGGSRLRGLGLPISNEASR
jgi:hypothetical protein